MVFYQCLIFLENGRHFAGHINRTVYVTGIPAECPRAILIGAVLEASKKIENAVVDRVVVTAPFNNSKPNRGFERYKNKILYLRIIVIGEFI